MVEIKIDRVLFDCVWSWIKFYVIRNGSILELFIFKHRKFGRDWRERK